MKDASVDELVGALFPGEKLPPSTVKTEATTTAGGVGSSNSGAATTSKKAQSSWDDDDSSDDDNNNNSKQPTAKVAGNAGVVSGPAPLLPSANAKMTTGVPSSSLLTSSTATANPNPSSTNTTTTKYVAKASAQWPTLPKNIVKFCDNSCVLTCRISQRDAQTHHRVMFSPGTAQQVENEADGSVAVAASTTTTNTVVYCPYMRCKKCDHPVVRLQDAYVVELKQQQQDNTAGGGGNNNSTSSSTSSRGAGSGGGHHKGQKQHDWDDSDDDDDDGQQHHHAVVGGGGGNVTPMYMLSRNHFPDFVALERTGAMRRCATSAPSTFALYWCQCTIASCGLDRVELLDTAATIAAQQQQQQQQQLRLSPEELRRRGITNADEAPYSSEEIRWVCVGHHAPKF